MLVYFSVYMHVMMHACMHACVCVCVCVCVRACARACDSFKLNIFNEVLTILFSKSGTLLLCKYV